MLSTSVRCVNLLSNRYFMHTNHKYVLYHFEAKYTPISRKNLEEYWREKYEDEKYYNHYISSLIESEKDCYILSMFPYPSGALHMGHVRVYTISDMMARFKRMQLKARTIHPMGWDAFGLPAENAAKERNLDPEIWTKKNIAAMKSQIKDLACSFDWAREISTCDPQYYRWTQFLFLKLFDAGLVYQKMGGVNWDPVDRTVLADEQIDSEGRSWRSGVKVQRKFLKQWYFKTTVFSKSLLEGLNEVKSELWRDVIELQKNWIGTCDGMQFNFQIQKLDDQFITIFTRHPKHISMATHILISKNHYLNNEKYFMKGVTINDQVIELNILAHNPINNQDLKIFLHTNFDFGEFRDTYIGIPGVSERDLQFAKENNLDYIPETEVSDESILLKHGYVTSEKGRDWCISRQRYWGTPIPIIHCPKYGAVPVSYSDLPVCLPKVANFNCSVEGKSPLSMCTEWLKSKCYKCDCGSYGTREIDTMDTFVDSSWYFLRYLDPFNQNTPFKSEIANRVMPVDLYIGGKEHATMHLYYARFICHFLHSIGHLQSREPFMNLLTQGMVLGKSFKDKETGKYLKFEEVKILNSKNTVLKDTGQPVVVEWEKMSKSKYNGVDPTIILKEYGSDSTRLAILSNVAPKSDRLWSDDVFVGVIRWQTRVWSLVADFLAVYEASHAPEKVDIKMDEYLCEMRNRTLLQINHHMNTTFLFNSAISQMQILTNQLKKVANESIQMSVSYQRCLFDLLILLFPFAPYFSSHLWMAIASTKERCKVAHLYNVTQPVFTQQWPVADAEYRLMLAVKVDGKDAFEVRLPMTHDQTANHLTADLAWQIIQTHCNYSYGNQEPSSLDDKLKVNKSKKNVEFESNKIYFKESLNKTKFLDFIESKVIANKQLVLYGSSKAEFLIQTKKIEKKNLP